MSQLRGAGSQERQGHRSGNHIPDFCGGLFSLNYIHFEDNYQQCGILFVIPKSAYQVSLEKQVMGKHQQEYIYISFNRGVDLVERFVRTGREA